MLTPVEAEVDVDLPIEAEGVCATPKKIPHSPIPKG